MAVHLAGDAVRIGRGARGGDDTTEDADQQHPQNRDEWFHFIAFLTLAGSSLSPPQLHQLTEAPLLNGYRKRPDIGLGRVLYSGRLRMFAAMKLSVYLAAL